MKLADILRFGRSRATDGHSASSPIDGPASQSIQSWASLWPNFTPLEVRCQGCPIQKPCRRDPYAIQSEAMSALQALRNRFGAAMRINSAYRCAFHNTRVGGAPLSRHKAGDAFDVSVRGMGDEQRVRLYENALHIGFTGTGFYRTFLHIDLGRRRSWFGSGGKQTWNG